VAMAAKRSQADVLLCRFHFALPGWDSAERKRDAQSDCREPAQARAHADGGGCRVGFWLAHNKHVQRTDEQRCRERSRDGWGMGNWRATATPATEHTQHTAA
jgi:hypothetical protein